jgi:phosphodiesterase/alkaline phosphatase D-like protein
MITRRRFVAAASAWMARPRLATGASSSVVQGVWCGAVDAHGATLKVLAASAGLAVTLRLSGPDAGAAEHTVVADGDGVASFVLTGLAPRTRYRYAVLAGGEPSLDGEFGTFADGPGSFRVVFASCANTGSTSDVFTAMQEQRPDLFVHMGDLHYEDIARNDVATYRDAYVRVLGSPTQAALFRAVPLAYTWDDHDFGENNSDRTSPSRIAALRAYRRFTPHYPVDEHPDAPIQQAFTVGRVRFLMTDVRSSRSPHRPWTSSRTMLGAAQLAWFERELEAAQSAPLVVWVNTVPWITRRFELFRQGWANYADERRSIANTITRLGLNGRLVMLSGDAHMLAFDDGTHSQYSTLPSAPSKGFVVAHAAPMDRTNSRKGGPYTHGPVMANGQYGILDVSDDGARVSVRIQGMQGRVPVPSMRLAFQA